MIQHFDIVVSGRVQGVFYRASTVEKAKSLGIKGIVKNLPDGSVAIEAEGDVNILKLLVDWCKQGPPMAKVEKVEKSVGFVKNYASFQILRA